MSACQQVNQWMTANVVVPVMTAITDAEQQCNDVGQWTDENVTQPVDNWVSQTQQSCQSWPWPLDWVCDAVTVLVDVITYVVVTVVKWVVTVVCQIVTVVVGWLTQLVIQLVAWLVTFVVCIFTDPLTALASIRDGWSINAGLTACGCELGAASTVLGLAAMAGTLGLQSARGAGIRSGQWVAWSLGVFALAAAGKVLGLVLAEVRLRSAIRVLLEKGSLHGRES